MTSSILFEEDEGQSDTTDERHDELGPIGDPNADPPEGVDRLSNDIVFGLLANERRRRVLNYLVENPNPTTQSDLAEHIASLENDKPVTALSSSERKSVYIALYQSHLPKMADANVIDFDKSRGGVQLRPEADQLLRYLSDELEETNRNDSWLRNLIPATVLALGTRLRG